MHTGHTAARAGQDAHTKETKRRSCKVHGFSDAPMIATAVGPLGSGSSQASFNVLPACTSSRCCPCCSCSCCWTHSVQQRCIVCYFKGVWCEWPFSSTFRSKPQRSCQRTPPPHMSVLLPPHLHLEDIVETHFEGERDVPAHMKIGHKVVYFVRHGQSMANVAEDNTQPEYRDAPLTELGHEQAKGLQDGLFEQ